MSSQEGLRSAAWSGGDDLAAESVAAIVAEGLTGTAQPRGRVAVLIPDATRTVDLTVLVPAVVDLLLARDCEVDVVVALGTHQPMSDDEIGAMIGVPAPEWAARFPHTWIGNHEWYEPGCLVPVGTIAEDRVADLSGGLLSEAIPVDVNGRVASADHVVVVGPVFPHEVVGFSGGNKYLFPGVSGSHMIARTHWLGALIGSTHLIGTPGVTPVRALIDEAAGLLSATRHCVAVVTGPGGRIRGVAVGTPEGAWRQASEWSAQLHVAYVDEPYDRALAVMPRMYADLWTGAKGMYKLDPVMADGGVLTIYAPHITEFSVSHGEVLDRIGYHVVDYFLQQWERFRDEPWGILAHSTHLRGSGSYDSVAGERSRITVVLATGISRERCESAGLGWRDPATVDPATFAAEADDRCLVVPHAGEQLYRLRTQDRT
ncbi:lactate racemase domain-containing protein [Nocardioides bigeumensis]|uniref:Lactate racemase domain-containing protein n=1 Tax=Nocardioides bigeumensis TaxID=433657 RepID=A0ABN2XLT0_9ACTN